MPDDQTEIIPAALRAYVTFSGSELTAYRLFSAPLPECVCSCFSNGLMLGDINTWNESRAKSM
jgi:hypothetical protein